MTEHIVYFRLEHVDVDIQELLQLQYEGVAVMNIFGKAKIYQIYARQQ